MNEWQPTLVDSKTGELYMEEDNLFAKVKTYINCSEGDTIFIKQDNFHGTDNQVALSKHELYNIIYNFMKNKELKRIMLERSKAFWSSNNI